MNVQWINITIGTFKLNAHTPEIMRLHHIKLYVIVCSVYFND